MNSSVSLPVLRHTPTWILLVGLLLVHVTANLIWLARDNSPPLWDMALHQTSGLRVHDYFSNAANRDDSWWSISGAYPPLYHHLIALAFQLGRESDRVIWANVPASGLLILGTYLLGRRFFSRSTGVHAAVVLLGFPYMAWMSRETTIDFTLAAMVICALVCLEYSEGFSRRNWSLAFGVLTALTALTKWIGPLFLVLPAVYVWWKKRRDDSRRALKNLLDGLIVAGILSLWWYLPKLPDIMSFQRQNTLVGAAEGEPPVLSLQSAIYYLRLLEGVQLQAIFFVLAGIGAVYSWRRKNHGVAFLLCWFLSGYVGLTLLRTKDPRFTLPYLPVLALFCTCWREGIRRPPWRTVTSILLIFLSVGHFCLVSFGANYLPQKIILLKGYQGSFSWDWKLFDQTYFGLLGPPAHNNWPHDVVLMRVMRTANPGVIKKLGIVPDLPRFNHENVRLQVQLNNCPVEVFRISRTDPAGIELLRSMDFVVVAEGEQGMGWSTASNLEINEFIFARPREFQVVAFASLPDGNALRIYRVHNP